MHDWLLCGKIDVDREAPTFVTACWARENHPTVLLIKLAEVREAAETPSGKTPAVLSMGLTKKVAVQHGVNVVDL